MNRLVEYSVLMVFAIIILGSLTGALINRPVFVSYTYSDSMKPTINIGDVFFINPLSRNPQVGDIIVFNVDGTWTVHRVVGIVADGYLTKGDNNIATDQSNNKIHPVKKSQIGGKVITVNEKPITIPKLGSYIDKNISNRTKMVLSGILVLFGVLMFTSNNEKSKKKKRPKFIRIKFKTLYMISGVLLLVMISAATFVSWQIFPIEYAVTSAGGAREGWYLPGETFEQEITIQNNNFYPMLYFVKAENPTIDDISETEFMLRSGEKKAIQVTITAPQETFLFTAKAKVNAYMPLLPASVITNLYNINPILPVLAMILEVSILLWVLYLISGIGDEDIIKIRTKRSAFWRQFKEGVFRI